MEAELLMTMTGLCYIYLYSRHLSQLLGVATMLGKDHVTVLRFDSAQQQCKHATTSSKQLAQMFRFF